MTDIDIYQRLAYITEIVESRLLTITQNYAQPDIDDDGWWVIGNSYLYLYNYVVNHKFIVDDVESMNQMLVQVAASIAATYREYSDRISSLDEDEQGMYALMFGFLWLYREYRDNPPSSRRLH
jgi:hypothetical protein